MANEFKTSPVLFIKNHLPSLSVLYSNSGPCSQLIFESEFRLGNIILPFLVVRGGKD